MARIERAIFVWRIVRPSELRNRLPIRRSKSKAGMVLARFFLTGSFFVRAKPVVDVDLFATDRHLDVAPAEAMLNGMLAQGDEFA
jgi:hypothetical protein